METKNKANNKTLHSGDLLAEISKAFPGIIYQFKMDKDGKQWFTFVSEGSKELIGKYPEELYDNLADAFAQVHPDDLQPLITSIQDSYNNLKPWHANFRIIDKQTNQIKWIEGNSMPKMQNDGTVVWNGRMNDVSEAKKAQDELALMKRVIDNSVEGIAICNLKEPGNPINYVNKSFLSLYGYKKDEVIGKNRSILFGAKTDAGTFEKIKTGILKHDFFEGEIELYRKDGTHFWNALTMLPLPDANGEITHYVSFHSDISQRKKAEAEIKAFNELLEKKVEERTQKLTEANKELETFNYTVSHDLQSPLRVINGYAKLLHRKYANTLDAEGQHYLNVIEESSVKMSRLVRELLAFAKLGRAKIDKSDVPMKTVVEMVLDELKQSHPRFKANVQIKPLKTIKADFGLMKQVWTNLIDNAIKYSSTKEQPEIEIGCFMKNGSQVFYIKDNGIGFETTDAEKLFEVFRRLGNAYEFDGTGIGLASVQRIIQRHGGKIWAESQLGEGATFYFSLPN